MVRVGAGVRVGVMFTVGVIIGVTVGVNIGATVGVRISVRIGIRNKTRVGVRRILNVFSGGELMVGVRVGMGLELGNCN